MKKLVFMFVAIAAISFASCNSNKPAPVTEDGTDTVSVDTMTVDTTITDTAIVTTTTDTTVVSE